MLIPIRRLFPALWFVLSAGSAAADPEPFNTESSGENPMAADEAAAGWKLPPGFQATAFASEPDVRQPISMCLDDRGRLWVAEAYTYAGHIGGYFEPKLRDRIVILEDTDHDGHHDRRTVFLDGLERLTAIEYGFGGIWALTLPHLVFIPDADRDDVPDGPPQVVLDGFDITRSAHTLANGLRWGPDGWLYGRQGILGTSRIGPPGAPEKDRAEISPGIWRVHPQRRVAEVVCEGTTNPWGMDWNAEGEAFFINTVIGHLWHVIPGAHYRRMFGEDLNPHVYHLIDQHADHVHWDTREVWSDVRRIGVTETSSSAGGGHAHTGLMIYLGDNWPDQYRGGLFTINFHGRRLNHDRLEPDGSGYAGRHNPDFAFSADPWFRGIDLLYGPDGAVYVSDWSDTGECHDDDGVHRQSGRIYRIAYGNPGAPAVRDVAALTDAELAGLLQHRNEWFARRARLELQARAAAGRDLTAVQSVLRRQFAESGDVVHRLRALWALHAIGAADDGFLRAQLDDPAEAVRVQAVRLLVDDRTRAAAPETTAALAGLAGREPTPRVRLALASALQRIPPEAVPAVARPLVRSEADARDHNLPLLLWYGIGPLAGSHRQAMADLAKHCRIPLTLVCIARRLTEDPGDPDGALQSLLRHAVDADPSWRIAVLTGMAEALAGIRQATAPPGWADFAASVDLSSPGLERTLYLSLGSAFGDSAALELNRRLALDSAEDTETRSEALRSLISARYPELDEICRSVFDAPHLAVTAAGGLAVTGSPEAGDFILQRLPGIPPADRPAVLNVLLSRRDWADRVLTAIESGSLSARDLSAYHARQIRSLNDESLTARLEKAWGSARESAADKVALIDRWKAYLTPAVLARADRSAGRGLFAALCGVCHRMYGHGGEVGPDLTGSGRSNLDYLLTNIIDPSAVVAADQQLSIVTLTDGRVLSGIIRRRDDRALTLQTTLEQVTIPATDVRDIESASVSLMPEGLLNALSETEVRDLIAWMMDTGSDAHDEPVNAGSADQDSADAPGPDLPAAGQEERPAEPAGIEAAGDWSVRVRSAGAAQPVVLDVEPPAITVVDAERIASLPVYNPAGGGWNNGARLAGNLAEECSTPRFIDIPSVVVRPELPDGSPGQPLTRGTDWEIEDFWGTIGRLPGGAIGEATPVLVSYRHHSQRLDSVVIDPGGRISIRKGTAVAANPLPPDLAPGERRLANLHVIGPAERITPENIYPVLESAWPEPPPAKTPDVLADVRRRLLTGEPLRIIAWGDSVTAAGYLPDEQKWQHQFARRLQETFPSSRVEWITEAWGGRSTLDYLNAPPGSGKNFAEQILNRKPDVVISEFVNDAHLPPESTLPRYRQILEALRSAGAVWIILTPHYVRPDWMHLTSEKNIDDDPRPYVATVRRFAATHPVALADAARRYGRLWRQGIPHTSLLVNSINHPDARGMTLFADALMDLFPPPSP